MTPVAPYVQTPHLTVVKWSTKVYKDMHVQRKFDQVLYSHLHFGIAILKNTPYFFKSLVFLYRCIWLLCVCMSSVKYIVSENVVEWNS